LLEEAFLLDFAAVLRQTPSPGPGSFFTDKIYRQFNSAALRYCYRMTLFPLTIKRVLTSKPEPFTWKIIR
jgi:hypothetical protein